MSGARRPSPDEIRLWQVATSDVHPLDGRARTSPGPAEPPAAPPPVSSGPSPGRARPADVSRAAGTGSARQAQSPASGHTQEFNGGVHRRLAQRLRRGGLPIDARLDLHGMTQEQAHATLLRFIERSHRSEHRAVLVITGKGTGTDPLGRPTGVLRRQVPAWLQEQPMRDRVLACEIAQPRHGGAGALYVLLRRRGAR